MPRLRTTALKDHPRPSSDVARTLWICTLATIGCSGDPAGPSVRTIGVTGTVVGALLLSVISNILNLTSIISVYLNAAVQGIVIIVVAFMQRRK